MSHRVAAWLTQEPLGKDLAEGATDGRPESPDHTEALAVMQARVSMAQERAARAAWWTAIATIVLAVATVALAVATVVVAGSS